jgi:signal recognition particle receptor subunit beta
MSIINYAKKEISFKIVYYGAGVVGKTVNLQYIHRSLPDDSRGNLISLATGDERTLFFDFLPVSTHSVRNFVAKFQLYTVPGQVYYNMTRKLVLRGVDGIVFVADSQWDRLQENLESFKNLEENLREYDYDLAELPYVIQYKSATCRTSPRWSTSSFSSTGERGACPISRPLRWTAGGCSTRSIRYREWSSSTDSHKNRGRPDEHPRRDTSRRGRPPHRRDPPSIPGGIERD